MGRVIRVLWQADRQLEEKHSPGWNTRVGQVHAIHRSGGRPEVYTDNSAQHSRVAQPGPPPHLVCIHRHLDQFSNTWKQAENRGVGTSPAVHSQRWVGCPVPCNRQTPASQPPVEGSIQAGQLLTCEMQTNCAEVVIMRASTHTNWLTGICQTRAVRGSACSSPTWKLRPTSPGC
jgi:hypothetical protein